MKLISLSAMICTLIICSVFPAGAQVDAGPDTVICPGMSVTLQATVTGGYGTENYVFETIPYSPEPYEGTAVYESDDDYDGPFNIGFDFCFMGETYSQFYIGSNGWVSFGGPGALTATYVSEPIPTTDPGAPKNCIMGPWEDWDPGYVPGVYIRYETVGTAPNRKLVVSWDEVPMFDCWYTEFGSFQIVLHETTSIIDNHLTHKPNCLSWFPTGTEGVHSLDGTLAYWAPGRNGTTWEADSESVRFVPSGITWYEGPTIIGYSDTITVMPDVTTTYTAEVTLCDGTTYSDDVTVIVGGSFTPTITTTDVSCNGESDGSANISVAGDTGPYTIMWSTGASGNSVSGLPAGDYTVSVSDTVGCTLSYPFTIDQPDPLVGTPELTEPTCFGYSDGIIVMNTSGGTIPYQYSLDGGSPTLINEFDGLSSGDYTITITDAHGCEETVPVHLGQPELLTVSLSGDTNIYAGQTATLYATIYPDYASINWSPLSPGDPCNIGNCDTVFVTPLTTTQYLITVTNSAGCVATDTLTVHVTFVPQVFFPNAFSPNGDGVNDLFQSIGYNILHYDMQIYDRWGELVYETGSPDYNNGWDGTFNGNDAPLGTYVWQATVTFTDGETFHKSGNFMLVR